MRWRVGYLALVIMGIGIEFAIRGPSGEATWSDLVQGPAICVGWGAVTIVDIRRRRPGRQKAPA